MDSVYDFVKYDIKRKIKDKLGCEVIGENKINSFDLEYGISENNNLFSLIDKNGRRVFNDSFNDLKSIGNDKFIYQMNDEYGIIDKENKTILFNQKNLLSKLKESNPNINLDIYKENDLKIVYMDNETFTCFTSNNKNKFLINKETIILVDWSTDDDFIIKNNVLAIKRGKICIIKDISGIILKKINLNFDFFLNCMNDNCIIIQNKKTYAYYKIDINEMNLSKLKLPRTSRIIKVEDNFVIEKATGERSIYDSNFNILCSSIKESVEVVANGYCVLEKIASLKKNYYSKIISLDNSVIYEYNDISCDSKCSEDMIIINTSSSSILFDTKMGEVHNIYGTNIISDFIGGLAVAYEVNNDNNCSCYLINTKGEKVIGNYKQIVLGKKYIVLDRLIIPREKINILQSEAGYDYYLRIYTVAGTYIEKKFEDMDSLLFFKENIEGDIAKIISEYEKEKEKLEIYAKIKQKRLIDNFKK